MSEQEGVCKYSLDHRIGRPPRHHLIQGLSAWRNVCVRLGLMGQDRDRYGGYGFGNISRLHGGEIVISGTQTGDIKTLLPMHYSRVTQWCQELNSVSATGTAKPSSEVLTHAAVYSAEPSVKFVIHAHCPEIWRSASKLMIPVTDPKVRYGTPAMAEEVGRLFRETHVRYSRIFAMGGHEDGIVSFGMTLAGAGTRLVTTLAEAMARAED